MGINFLAKTFPKASRMYLNRPHCRCPRVSPPASGALPRHESRRSGWLVSGSTESRHGGREAFPGHLAHVFHAGEYTESSEISFHPFHIELSPVTAFPHSVQCNIGFSSGSVVKNPPASTVDAGDLGSIPGSGKSPGEGNGYPLQYSCLENSMDRGGWRATVHGVAKSQTWLSNWARMQPGTGLAKKVR